jgi:hypothetical protein
MAAETHHWWEWALAAFGVLLLVLWVRAKALTAAQTPVESVVLPVSTDDTSLPSSVSAVNPETGLSQILFWPAASLSSLPASSATPDSSVPAATPAVTPAYSGQLAADVTWNPQLANVTPDEEVQIADLAGTGATLSTLTPAQLSLVTTADPSITWQHKPGAGPGDDAGVEVGNQALYDLEGDAQEAVTGNIEAPASGFWNFVGGLGPAAAGIVAPGGGAAASVGAGLAKG